jgi:hypothetical protein
MTRAQSRASTRKDAVIVIQCILNLAVNAEIPIRPQAGMVDLFRRRGFVMIVLNRAGAAGIGDIILVVVDKVLFLALNSGVVDVGRVACLKLAFLRAAACSTRPGKAT